MRAPIYSTLMQLWNAYPMHFICVQLWLYSSSSSAACGKGHSQEQNYIYSVHVSTAYRGSGCPQNPPSSGTSPSGALAPTGRLQKVKAYIRVRSREVTTCLWLISPPQNGDNNCFSTLVHLLSLYYKSPRKVLSLIACVPRQTQQTPVETQALLQSR